MANPENITAFFAGISLVLSGYLKYKENVQKKINIQTSAELEENKLRNKAIQEGVFALLKDRLVTEYRHITDRVDTNNLPFIYFYELENIQKLNEEYHNLGGNGTVAKLVKELTTLPVKKIS